MSEQIIGDAELAARLAHAAGRILVEVRTSALFEGKSLGSAGDEVSNRYLIEALKHHRPEDGLLSEESRDTLARLDERRVWIIDPVDGTREFGESRSDWAVHVGLAIDGVAQIGAVALPGLDGGMVFRTDRISAIPDHDGPPRLLVSRTRPAAEAVAVAERLGGELVPMGSAGAKAMAVIRGEADIYLHSGGQYEWDSCAPVAVARAHGLHCSRIDGSELVYNQHDTYLPDLLICRPEWTKKVLDAVSELG
jgi:3'(2'), 5'-bisphosphate nucleotidase